MRFRRVPPDDNFSMLRLVSEGGKWEVDLYPVLFGVRIRCGQVGACAVVLDYCAGADINLRVEILLLVLQVLEAMDEASTTEGDIDRAFPKWTRRPIDRDPICLPKLREIAAATSGDDAFARAAATCSGVQV